MASCSIAVFPSAQTPIGQEHGRDNLVRLFQRKSRVPVRVIDLKTIRGDRRNLRNALTLPGSWIAIADAETDDDLISLAETAIASGIRLFSGAAGLTGVLGGRLPIDQVHRPPTIVRSDKPILVVAGSRHTATAGQIAVAEAAGATRITLDQDHLDADHPNLDTIQTAVLSSLATGNTTILTTIGLGPSRHGGALVSERLATAAITPEILECIGGLVLTGGDVAHAVCRLLGVRTIWLRGEVLPAIPWATLTSERANGMPVVTKAGSFGEPHAIQAAIEHLNAL